MYKLAVNYGGFTKGHPVTIGTKFYAPATNLLLCDENVIALADDLQTLIEGGIIEGTPDPVWTDEEMMEFITRYCEHNFLPLNYIDEALNEFKIYKGKNS